MPIADFSKMLPDDFAVVREYLKRRSLMHSEAREETSRRLARQVKAVLSIAQLPFDMAPDLFLESVYLAYQKDAH
ncbi:MAG: hypothetical protein HC852_21815 [Acaryochloridaceae cyanobacterium RU_4_10]|nr:hypothetical protein [Acaryochloridaceae cyanobacterium RU_4_10]